MFGERGGKSMCSLKTRVTSATWSAHEELEAAVYQAFPTIPVPTFVWPQRNAIDFDAQKLLDGLAWPNAVGWRLYGGERDLSLSIWMSSLGSAIMKYYLPSHLIFASILMKLQETNHEYMVMEALILPPNGGIEVLDEINRELSLDAQVTYYGKVRVELYKVLSEDQRRCVAKFLSLYLGYNRTRFTERGIQLFQQNSDFWHNSSLPEISN